MPLVENTTAPAGGGTGTVTNVSSANTAIAVATPTTTPVLTLAALDVIAADGPPAANWSNNSKKITALANGTAAQDAVAFNQLPAIGVIAADVTITGSTTLADLTGLAFSIGASATEVWFVEAFLFLIAANVTMDYKVGFTAPSGAGMGWGITGLAGVGGINGWGVQGVASTPAGLSSTPAGPIAAGTAAAAIQGQAFAGWVTGGGNAGTVQMQGAQNTSDGGNLVFKKGSLLRATKVAA